MNLYNVYYALNRLRLDTDVAVPSIRFRSQQEADDAQTPRKKSKRPLETRERRLLVHDAEKAHSSQ